MCSFPVEVLLAKALHFPLVLLLHLFFAQHHLCCMCPLPFCPLAVVFQLTLSPFLLLLALAFYFLSHCLHMLSETLIPEQCLCLTAVKLHGFHVYLTAPEFPMPALLI